MAYGKKRGGRGGSKPDFFVSLSVAVRKGKYKRGPAMGMWSGEERGGPMAKGTLKAGYLKEHIAFLKSAYAKDLSVSYALFKNKPHKSRDEEDEDDDDDFETEEDEDEDGDEDEDDDDDDGRWDFNKKKEDKSNDKESD